MELQTYRFWDKVHQSDIRSSCLPIWPVPSLHLNRIYPTMDTALIDSSSCIIVTHTDLANWILSATKRRWHLFYFVVDSTVLSGLFSIIYCTFQWREPPPEQACSTLLDEIWKNIRQDAFPNTDNYYQTASHFKTSRSALHLTFIPGKNMYANNLVLSPQENIGGLWRRIYPTSKVSLDWHYGNLKMKAFSGVPASGRVTSYVGSWRAQGWGITLATMWILHGISDINIRANTARIYTYIKDHNAHFRIYFIATDKIVARLHFISQTYPSRLNSPRRYNW